MSPEEELKSPPYPTLDSTGWVTKPEVKADAVLLDYLQASYSQSVIFQGKVRSFQYSIQQHQHDPLALERAVQDDCRVKFGAYFEIVEPRCIVRDLGKAYSGSGSAFDVEITVDVVQNGVSVSVGRMLSIIDSKLAKITPLAVV